MKSTFLLGFFLCIYAVTFSQLHSDSNNTKPADRAGLSSIRLGFSVGTGVAASHIKMNRGNVPTPGNPFWSTIDASNPQPGIVLGILGKFQINPNWHFRIAPDISLDSQLFTSEFYTNPGNRDSTATQEFEPARISLPLQFIYVRPSHHNVNLFIGVGVAGQYWLGSKSLQNNFLGTGTAGFKPFTIAPTFSTGVLIQKLRMMVELQGSQGIFDQAISKNQATGISHYQESSLKLILRFF